MFEISRLKVSLNYNIYGGVNLILLYWVYIKIQFLKLVYTSINDIRRNHNHNNVRTKHYPTIIIFFFPCGIGLKYSYCSLPRTWNVPLGGPSFSTSIYAFYNY